LLYGKNPTTLQYVLDINQIYNKPKFSLLFNNGYRNNVTTPRSLLEPARPENEPAGGIVRGTVYTVCMHRLLNMSDAKSVDQGILDQHAQRQEC